MASQGPEKGRVHVSVILKSLPRGGFILASWSKVVFLRVYVLIPLRLISWILSNNNINDNIVCTCVLVLRLSGFNVSYQV